MFVLLALWATCLFISKNDLLLLVGVALLLLVGRMLLGFFYYF